LQSIHHRDIKVKSDPPEYCKKLLKDKVIPVFTKYSDDPELVTAAIKAIYEMAYLGDPISEDTCKETCHLITSSMIKYWRNPELQTIACSALSYMKGKNNRLKMINLNTSVLAMNVLLNHPSNSKALCAMLDIIGLLTIEESEKNLMTAFNFVDLLMRVLNSNKNDFKVICKAAGVFANIATVARGKAQLIRFDVKGFMEEVKKNQHFIDLRADEKHNVDAVIKVIENRGVQTMKSN